MKKRVFLIVIDSCGVGAMPDAASWGDEGSNTLVGASRAAGFAVPNMQSMGLWNIDGLPKDRAVAAPRAAYGRMAERSRGKDTTVGHWEIAGVISDKPFPTYPEGFPPEVISAFEAAIGRRCLCNRPYSGTQVIADYGREHIATGYPIVYTSADSVFQIAAHEDVIPLEQLYEMCRKARAILVGRHGVGRVIARPFTGEYPYTRTANRHDFSLVPPPTMLNVLQSAGYDTLSVGKIVDIFAESGITRYWRTQGNADGLARMLEMQALDFEGLCFVNLVDTDMIYGHRRDVQGYGDALGAIDATLGTFMGRMREGDLLMVTADHGCDPTFKGTDHTREYVPLLIYGKGVVPQNLGTLATFADVSATILDYFALDALVGDSLLPRLVERK
jgi:phosphopentomutase